VYAHGKWIEVETLDTGATAANPRAKRRDKLPEAYALLPLTWAAEMAKVSKAPHVMVWIVLAHLVRATSNTTVNLTNEIMARYGVDRWMKYRGLARLEKAGSVRVNRRNK
jgi:hypothetical protein